MNTEKKQEPELLQSVEVKSPWFKIRVDDIDWKTIIVVAMILGTIVYLVKG